VELGDGLLISARGKNTICEERLNSRKKFGLEGLFFIAFTRGGCNISMGGVGNSKGRD